MAEFGTLCLYLALASSGWALIAAYNGGRARLGELVLSAERAVYATWVLVLLAVVSLEYCIFTDQFGLEYVASYSNRALPKLYKITALWGGQAGSLLFWEFILITYASLIVLTNRRLNRPLLPFVVATLAFVSTFFLGLVNFMARPFVRLAFTPEDGNGLNPQLQNVFMAIHPPCLYLGYVGLTLPFAFAMAALATGRLDDTWFRTTRRWTILSWFFLGTGILLGGWWAYVELGWGGYWAWDPVENASLIPWLTCTAFLHSVMIEERKKMLRVWNLSLVIMSFLLAILGTFITRSGVISSVHSFTKSDIGPVFAGFLGLCTLVSVGLLLYRLPELKSEHRLDSFVSRESTFLFNNSSHGIQAAYKSLPYDLLADFTPVSPIAYSSVVLAVAPDSPAKTLPEFIGHVRQHPGKVAFGSFGVGTSSHLYGEILNLSAGIDMLHIAYKGSAPALSDLMGGHIQALFVDAIAAMSVADTGKIRALAITGTKRWKAYANLPTFGELGYTELGSPGWWGFFASSKVPPQIVARMAEELKKVVAMPDVASKLSEIGAEAHSDTPAHFAVTVQADVARWKRIVKERKLSLE